MRGLNNIILLPEISLAFFFFIINVAKNRLREFLFKCIDICFTSIELIPVNGEWGNWNGWSSCDKSCGGGERSRSRFCDAPYPQNGGSPCAGDGIEKESCNIDQCPGKVCVRV